MSAVSATSRPVIGISAYSQNARWGSWDLPAVLLPRRYTDMVALAGGLPVLLPPMDGVAGLLPRLDGLVLSGGGDLDPALYGAERDPDCGPPSPARDSAELELCRHALASGLPVLGICRGLQVINVALGGTLHQHLPGLVGNDSHSPTRPATAAIRSPSGPAPSCLMCSAAARPPFRRTTTRPSTGSAPGSRPLPGPTTA